jgi:hypothetical protein
MCDFPATGRLTKERHDAAIAYVLLHAFVHIMISFGDSSMQEAYKGRVSATLEEMILQGLDTKNTYACML